MADPVFEVVMRCKNPDNPIKRITIRTLGLAKETAVELAEKDFGKDYQTYYVIAGPRIED